MAVTLDVFEDLGSDAFGALSLPMSLGQSPLPAGTWTRFCKVSGFVLIWFPDAMTKSNLGEEFYVITQVTVCH